MTNKHPLEEAAKHLRHFMCSVGTMADQDSADCVATYLGDASRQIAALEQRVQELSSVRAKLVETKLPIPDWDDDGTCGPMQSSANPPESAQPHGTARSEVHQAPITDHAGEGGEPSIADLKRWEPDWDRVKATIDFQATLLEPHNVDTLKDLVAHTAHVVAQQCNDQLASLRARVEAAETFDHLRYNQREQEWEKRASDQNDARLALEADRDSWRRVSERLESEKRDLQKSVKGLRQGKGEREREINRLKSRLIDLEAIAPRIEPSDEDIDDVWQSLCDGPALHLDAADFRTIARAVLALAPRQYSHVEPSDEELRRLFEGRSWPVLTNWKAFRELANAVLALTRPPDGAVRWSDKAVVNGTLKSQWASTTEKPESEALKPFPLGTRGTVHCVFVPTETKEQG